MRIRISSHFFQSLDLSENENWRSKNFFGSASLRSCPLPIIPLCRAKEAKKQQQQQQNKAWSQVMAQLIIVSGHCLKIILSAPAIGTKSAVKAMIICSKKGRAVKIKEVAHCICWRRIHSSYRLEQDCMEGPLLTEWTLGYVQYIWHPWRFCRGE